MATFYPRHFSMCMIVLCVIIGFTSCVSSKKYKAQVAQTNRQEQENARIKRLLTVSQSQYGEMEDSLLSNSKIFEIQSKVLDSVQFEYLKLKTYNDTLSTKLMQRTQELMTKEEALENQEKNLKVLRYRNYQRQAQSAELQKAIKAAFSSLNKESFSVEEKSGRLYISFSNKLLFETASIDINPEGKKNLQKLAELLKKYTNELDIWVEGHTDNVPVTGAELPFKDNWQLSALRAAVVVDILVKGGVAPTRISANGKGQYTPIASNSSAEGKSENRRIEIVLLPKLDELFELIGK